MTHGSDSCPRFLKGTFGLVFLALLIADALASMYFVKSYMATWIVFLLGVCCLLLPLFTLRILTPVLWQISRLGRARDMEELLYKLDALEGRERSRKPFKFRDS